MTTSFSLFFVTTVLLSFSSAFFTIKTSSSSSSLWTLLHDHDDIGSLIRLTSDSANNDIILRNFLNNQQIILDTADAGETRKHDPQSSQVMLEGVVSKRRVIGKHLVFIDVVPMELPTYPTQQSTIWPLIYKEIESIAPVHVIMMRDYWNNTNDHCTSNASCSYDIYHKIIQPGVHVQLTGHVGLSRNRAAGAIVFCHTVKYTLLNDNPQHLQTVLRYTREGSLDMNEVIDAIPLIRHAELTSQEYSLSELASAVLDRFPKNYLFNPSKLMGSTNRQKRNLLPLAPSEFMMAPLFDMDRNQFSEDHTTSARTTTLNEILVTVSGMVRNRRRYQGCITVLTLTEPIILLGNDDIATMSAKDFGSQQLSVVLHPNVMKATSIESSSSLSSSQVYGNILSSGACVSVQGYIMTTGSHEIAPIMWAASCRMIRSSWRPNAIRQVLDTLHEGNIAVDEAADALKLPGGYSQAEDIAKGNISAVERQWLAATLTQSLQGQHSLLGTVTASMTQSLASFAYARDKYPVEHVNIDSELDMSLGALQVLQSSDSNLRSSPDVSRWQRAKKPQLAFMIKQIGTVLRSHPEFGQRKLKVVDIGGGRGLLSNLLAELFGDAVEVQVVDISQSATNNGMMKAKRRGLQNIQYTALDATTLDANGVDVVVALHACGALADVALGHATSQGAGFVVCPCCYLSNPHLRVPVPTGRNVRSEPIPVEDWLMVDSTQYEQLKRTAEVQGNIELASEAMHTVCGLRSTAVDRLWQGREGLTIKIKRFPITFSTRNFCLVGSFIKI